MEKRRHQEAQQELRSSIPENINEYAGQWVAIRDGEVIASSEDESDLFTLEQILTAEMILPVPAPESHTRLHL